MPGKIATIAEITHPRYDLRYREWYKWRITYHGGPQFITAYLQQYSKREDVNDFNTRKALTYAPTFSKSAINEVKSSLYQRLIDITRDGGSDTYKKACDGWDNGVDLLGNTMTRYMGDKVLTELLVMGRVGVYVDMPPMPEEPTMLALGKKRPYIYMYETEDIRSWTYDDSNAPNEFGSLLLRDYVYVYDENTGLPKGQQARFRHYWLQDGDVYVQFYDAEGGQINQLGTPADGMEPIKLGINRIPFVILELSDSLMVDIANYQIALLNICSSDLMYILKSNFPFYVEQYEPRATSTFQRTAGLDAPGSAADAATAKDNEIVVGAGQGRRYPVGAERPGFIAPPTEPIRASMEKQQQIKEEIRLLIGLGISNLLPRVTSAQAKGFDERTVESGLSAIGKELEFAERMIAVYWGMYEKWKEPATVKYPEKYDLKPDEMRLKEATDTAKLIPEIASKTYQIEMQKKVAEIMLGHRVPLDVLNKIEKEIMAAKGTTSDPEAIKNDVELGICSLDYAAELRGYPKDSVKKAADEHAERLKRIAESQAPGKGLGATADDPGARGVKDMAPNTGQGAKIEKGQNKDKSGKDAPTDGVRGKGAKIDKGSE